MASCSSACMPFPGTRCWRIPSSAACSAGCESLQADAFLRPLQQRHAQRKVFAQLPCQQEIVPDQRLRMAAEFDDALRPAQQVAYAQCGALRRTDTKTGPAI